MVELFRRVWRENLYQTPFKSLSVGTILKRLSPEQLEGLFSRQVNECECCSLTEAFFTEFNKSPTFSLKQKSTSPLDLPCKILANM